MSPEDEIDAIVMAVLEQTGLDMASDIQSTLSIQYPPASVPGESPHKRTGNLQAGVKYLVRQDGPIYLLEVASEAPYSARLEGPMNRQFMGPAQQYWAPVLVQRLQDAFGHSTQSIPDSVALSIPTADLGRFFGIDLAA